MKRPFDIIISLIALTIFTPLLFLISIAILVFDGLLYFNAYDNRGQEIWVSDGTLNGTELYEEIDASMDGMGEYADSRVSGFLIMDNHLYCIDSNYIYKLGMIETNMIIG